MENKLTRHDYRSFERRLLKIIKKGFYPSVFSIEIFPDSLIEKHAEVLDWKKISELYSLSSEFIYKFAHLINWKYLSRNVKQIIPEDILEEKIEELDICSMLYLNKIPESIKVRFSSYIMYKMKRRNKEGGYVFSPFLPLQVSPIVIQELSGYTPRIGISSRYASKIVNNNFYTTLTVNEL